MANKSSLKTFLAGKNPYNGNYHLEGSDNPDVVLDFVTTDAGDFYFTQGYVLDNSYQVWYIDILNDGTAITYCRDV
jgi:hypothetical protein